MTETAETRLKRMRMRSWRRGTKEMDLVLGPYADARLAAMVLRLDKLALAQAQAAAPEGLHLALKSGNFGAPDFFTQAFTILE